MTAVAILTVATGCATRSQSSQHTTTSASIKSDQPAIPDTPAGQIFSAWLTAFNAADAAQLSAFKEQYQRTGKVEDDLRWRDAVGGYELLRIEDSQPDSLVALLRETDAEGGMRLRLNSSGDRVGDNLTFQVEKASLPSEFIVPRLSTTAALASTIARANQYAQQDRFSGVLLIARHGEILLHRGWGTAQRESKRPVTLATRFRLASINKMFTAVAVLQLVDAGKLSLSDTVGQHLRDYPNQEIASKVTIHHLLTHTGGTGDFFGPEFRAHRTRLKEHSDYLKLFGERGVQFEPGTQYAYSNYGFVILGLVIERISGMSYHDYVQRHIYDVAGMSRTGSLPQSEIVPDLADGYTRRDGKWVSNADVVIYRGIAAGDGYSTAGDLLRFAEALKAGRLLSSRALAQATRPQSLDAAYGYGMRLQGEAPMNSYGHGGGAPGRDSELRIFPQTGYVLIGLSNRDPRAAKNLLEHAAVRLPVDR